MRIRQDPTPAGFVMDREDDVGIAGIDDEQHAYGTTDDLACRVSSVAGLARMNPRLPVKGTCNHHDRRWAGITSLDRSPEGVST